MKSNWEIYLAFREVKLLIEEIKALPPGDEQARMALVKKRLGKCFPGQTSIPGLSHDFLFNPFDVNFDWLLTHLDSLEKIDVENLIEDALVKSQLLLPDFTGFICILPGNHPQITTHPMLQTVGLIGDTKRTLIRLYIGPVEGWQNWLNTVVAHEYNHYARFQTTPVNNLRDYLISEGLAESYSQAIVPDMKTPYTAVDFISTNEINRVWQIMSPKLEDVGYNIFDPKRMAAHDKDYSFLAKEQIDTLEYTVGHQIVQSYINRRYVQNGQDIDWLEITQLASATILNESDFAHSD